MTAKDNSEKITSLENKLRAVYAELQTGGTNIASFNSDTEFSAAMAAIYQARAFERIADELAGIRAELRNLNRE